MKSTLSLLVAASALALLSACGGDGGGDSSTPPTGSPQVAITSSNQSGVARASVNAGLAVSLAQGSLGGGASAAAATRAHALGAVLQRALDAAQAQRRGISSASAHPAGTSSQVTDCDVSGTLTTTLADNDGNGGLSAGDVITATFSQCAETGALSINGVLVVSLTGTPTSSEFLANANFRNVVVVDSGVSSTISGTVAVDESDESTRTETILTVGASGLNVTIASTNYNDSIAFQSGMVILTSEFSDGSVAVNMTGTFSAQSIGGEVSIVTPLGVRQGASDAYPSVGQFIITGASGSAVRATVLDATQVKLELDANGDGTFESTSNVAWSTLIP